MEKSSLSFSQRWRLSRPLLMAAFRIMRSGTGGGPATEHIFTFEPPEQENTVAPGKVTFWAAKRPAVTGE